MGMRLSLIAAGTFFVLAIFSGWRGAQAPNLIKGPRLIPWRGLMVLFAFGVFATLSMAALYYQQAHGG